MLFADRTATKPSFRITIVKLMPERFQIAVSMSTYPGTIVLLPALAKAVFFCELNMVARLFIAFLGQSSGVIHDRRMKRLKELDWEKQLRGLYT